MMFLYLMLISILYLRSLLLVLSISCTQLSLLVMNEVREAPSMEECIDEFKASLTFMKELPQLQEHCQKFLNSFIAVRGSYANAAKALAKAIRKELGLDFIDIDD